MLHVGRRRRAGSGVPPARARRARGRSGSTPPTWCSTAPAPTAPRTGSATANIPAVGELAARPHIAGGLEDMLGERKDHYAGQSIALVGDGYSAATTICALAALAEEHPATWVFWLTRGARGQPLPRIAERPVQGARPARGEGELARHALRRQPRVPPADGDRRGDLATGRTRGSASPGGATASRCRGKSSA